MKKTPNSLVEIKSLLSDSFSFLALNALVILGIEALLYGAAELYHHRFDRLPIAILPSLSAVAVVLVWKLSVGPHEADRQRMSTLSDRALAVVFSNVGEEKFKELIRDPFANVEWPPKDAANTGVLTNEEAKEVLNALKRFPYDRVKWTLESQGKDI